MPEGDDIIEPIIEPTAEETPAEVSEIATLSERVASLETIVAELASRLGVHDERFTGLESAFGGGEEPVEPDHGPTSDHPWFRKLGGKSWK